MSKILRLLHTATFGIALAFTSINAQAELFRVALSTKDFGYLPLYVGIRSGLFAQEGLEIQWIVINSNVVVTALIAGEIDVAGIAGSSMRAAARGAPLKRSSERLHQSHRFTELRRRYGRSDAQEHRPHHHPAIEA